MHKGNTQVRYKTVTVASTDNAPAINLQEFFEPKIKNVLTEIEQDKRLVEKYYASGLTMAEFGETVGLTHDQVYNKLRKYNLPARVLDSKTVRQIKARSKKNKAELLKNNCNCISANLLRTILTHVRKEVA